MDGRAVVLCEGCFDSDNGKTAHGLVRHTERYEVVAVLDSGVAGRDSGEFLDGVPNGIPLIAALDEAASAQYLVIGLAPEGGQLPGECREIVKQAMRSGLNVDSGLHEFLSDDAELASIARTNNVTIRDIRKPPPRRDLHFFSGDIARVKSKRIAVLGTDCALGKRTTAVLLVAALRACGTSAELIGTGQTSWLQGVRYGILLDSIVNDFVGGELEHAIVTADRNAAPDVMIIEGQACLTHPAGSGGFEILGSARPQGVILQHAPARRTYSGYDDFPIAPPEAHIQAIEQLFGARVIAIGVNSEGLTADGIAAAVAELEHKHGIPCCDPLTQGPQKLVDAVTAL